MNLGSCPECGRDVRKVGDPLVYWCKHDGVLQAVRRGGVTRLEKVAEPSVHISRIAAEIVMKSAEIARIEAAIIRKTRNPPDDADPATRSKFNGPAAKRLAEIEARWRETWAFFNGGGRERHRLQDQEREELRRARAAAELEAYSRSPEVTTSYAKYSKHLMGED